MELVDNGLILSAFFILINFILSFFGQKPIPTHQKALLYYRTDTNQGGGMLSHASSKTFEVSQSHLF